MREILREILIEIHERPEVVGVNSGMDSQFVSIERIVLSPEQYAVSFLEEAPMEHLKDMASRELANMLIGKLVYNSYSSPGMMGKRQATFSIYDCTTSEKEIFNKRIKSYQDDIKGRDIAIKSLNKDKQLLRKTISDYKSETLWKMIKRWWKR